MTSPSAPGGSAAPTLAAATEDRPLLAFLPMVYVAWADGELSGDEIATIARRCSGSEGLDERSRERLRRWLDPDHPPAARELAAMLRLIQRTAPELPGERRSSLAELGAALARAGGAGEPAPPVRQALAEIEAALGVVGTEASRELLAAGRPRPEPTLAPRPAPEPAFDPAALQRHLDGEHGDVRRRVRDFLAEPAHGPRHGLATEEYREQVLAWTRELAERGLGALAFPPEAGGTGDVGAFIAAFETLAFGDLSLVVKYGVQFGLFGGSVAQLGTERHHREYLGPIGRLELPGGFAMTEIGHGSNVRDLETVARYDRDTGELVIHTPHPGARKDWIGNAARHGRMVTVFAQLEVPARDGEAAGGAESHGVHAILVPIRDERGRPLPGVTLEDCGLKAGLNGVDNGRITFDQVRVPRENLLDRFGRISSAGEYTSPIPSPGRRFFTMLGTLVGGRISVAAAAVSAAKVGLAVAVRYGERRRQFGPSGGAEIPILDYPAHQRRLLPRLAAAYAWHFAAREVARRFGARMAAGGAGDGGARDRDAAANEESQAVEALAAGVKALATWQTVETLQTCRECCGGQGYLAANRFARLKDDTDVFTTFEGDNTVLLQLVARALLGRYKQQFGELRPFTLVNHLLHRARTGIAEKNPLVARRTDRQHLRDPAFHGAALAYREERLLTTVARRLKHRLDAGMDSFDAFNECQDHLLATARAWTERVAHDAFRAGVDGCDDPASAATLGALCRLWALWRLEVDTGWFQENGYFEAPKAGALRAEVLALCAELRSAALPLVDAFGVPAQWLAPIALDSEP
ncbi:MAG TPA: acyl-CoA dehydrogenase [Thermoanaerobaculia bacterium]|nr:acyl-CoA dehydrogenase [Thermoanaerobaculia bacterium]